MSKHFCNCTDLDCPHNPHNQESPNCDGCIKINLEAGEIPTCMWFNMEKGISSDSKYSALNFAKSIMEREGKKQ